MNTDGVLAELRASAGVPDQTRGVPAWALLLRSPFRPWADATSWLGGTPRGPAGFDWPCDAEGAPLHFLAQIDLAALLPEPRTGARAPGLPDNGALLVFGGGRPYAVRLLPGEVMREAADLRPPRGLAPISHIGYWSEAPTFTRWPVDPVPYLSGGEERPSGFAERFTSPTDWITTWAIARLDAELLLEGLNRELRFGRDFLEKHRLGKYPQTTVVEERMAFFKGLARNAPALLPELEAWRDRAAAEPPEGPVDDAELDAVLLERMSFADGMPNIGFRHLLLGDAAQVWNRLRQDYREAFESTDFTAIPAGYRPFVEARVTDWRGHRLFGLEPPFPNNSEDLRGHDVLISIRSDELLKTASEHDYGMSVWCRRESLQSHRYEDGQFVRHCAV